MKGYIELHYISPRSNYIFNKSDEYILVLLHTDTVSNTIVIQKAIVKNIGNIDEEIRAYLIKESLPYLKNTVYTIHLFQHQKKSNIIYQLFTGSINMQDVEYNNPTRLILTQPPFVQEAPNPKTSKFLGEPRSAIYHGDQSFLSEQFYHFESDQGNNKDKLFCLLIFTKVYKTNFYLGPTSYIQYDSSNNIMIYDRYNNLVINELIPTKLEPMDPLYKKHYKHIKYFVDNICKDYNKYVKEYQIDTRTNAAEHRQLKFDPYLNNIITSSIDGRVRGFKINATLKFQLYDKTFYIKDLVTNTAELDGGSGFISRVCPQDYNYYYTPYAGYLKNVIKSNDGQIVVLKFESDYFIPPNVEQRDYASLVYGNFIYTGVGVGGVSGGYPELLELQPDTHLIFYVVLMGSVELTNVNLNKNIWFEQGMELGKFKCNDGTVIFLTNRQLVFTADVDYYSKLTVNGLNKPIDTYIKARDIVGLLF